MPWLLTTVPEPPWSLVQRPIQSSVLRPHSRLLDPRWAAAVGGFVADTVKLQERLHKGEKKGGKEEAEGLRYEVQRRTHGMPPVLRTVAPLLYFALESM